ncbi:PAAR domain-containing protein [Pseudomonas sp. TH10]|nr:PAAR domain-containing protein [Pseudomonas sp. TH10]
MVSPHGTIVTTSTNVFINSTAATRKDDKAACGATISSGAAT